MTLNVNNVVEIAIGHKNAAGDWIVDRMDVVEYTPTTIDQIVITEGRRPGIYNLTHLQSGFLLLSGFPTITQALVAAETLAKLFPIKNWDAMGKLGGAFSRGNVNRMYARLTDEEKSWMRQWGVK